LHLDALPLAQPRGLGPSQRLISVLIEDIGHEPREVCTFNEALEVFEAEVKVVVAKACRVDVHGVKNRRLRACRAGQSRQTRAVAKER